MSDVRCAACGEPGHRYGRNEGMDRFDPMACINGLRGRIEEMREEALAALRSEGWEVYRPDECAVADVAYPDWTLVRSNAALRMPGRYRLVPVPVESEDHDA